MHAAAHQPAALVLTRQNLPTLDRTIRPGRGLARGGYVLADAPEGKPEVILIATGSEVASRGGLREARRRGHQARVVSMPCWELFEPSRPSIATRCCRPR